MTLMNTSDCSVFPRILGSGHPHFARGDRVEVGTMRREKGGDAGDGGSAPLKWLTALPISEVNL